MSYYDAVRDLEKIMLQPGYNPIFQYLLTKRVYWQAFSENIVAFHSITKDIFPQTHSVAIFYTKHLTVNDLYFGILLWDEHR